MSNTGIRGYYLVTNTIKEQLLKDVNVNEVTSGDISQVNLQKQNIFPLAHIMVNNVTIGEQTLTFNVSVMGMDIVNTSKQETVDIFRGNDNHQDILNTQLSVINEVVQLLSRGDLYTDGFQLDGEPNAEPFVDRFENQLAGWSVTMDIIIRNDISIC
tara:strand:+ start:1106 stop:1576 length:471 start_codon:yes stop_codon:yes gene_type:complete